MSSDTSGLQRWTKRYTVTSAVAFVAYLVTDLRLDNSQTGVLIYVFGFVCPMIFGMAYLLLPPYVGRTLVDYRLPGVHFVLAYLGVILLAFGWQRGGTGTLFSLGAVCWTFGILVFGGSLAVTVGPELLRQRGELLRGGDRPQRSSKLATATIPVAIGYLCVGTLVLLASSDIIDIGSLTVSQVVHYYMIGFGMLLVFALGVRLLIGFFHVTPPRPLVWITLTAGMLTPPALGSFLWLQPWFRIGGILAGFAMGGYVSLVGFVAVRTDRIRPGLYGIVFGAVSGVIAVGAAVPIAFGVGSGVVLELHRTAILTGFFPLTIVGYAYQFFPVDDVRLLDTGIEYTTLTIGLLGVGVIFQGIGIVSHAPFVQTAGNGSSILGIAGYVSLLVHRFYR